MPYVIQLQIKNPVYLAGLDPTLHRTFRRDHALVFMIPPSDDQVKHCTYHFPDAHVVEVQPEPEQVKAAEIKDLADAYREALRMVPVEFREFGDTLDSRVAKLAKAYEQFQAELEAAKNLNAEHEKREAMLLASKNHWIAEVNKIAAAVPEVIFNDTGNVLRSVTRLAAEWTGQHEAIEKLNAQNAKLNTDLIENTLINDGLHRDIDARTDAITQIKDDRDRLLADRNSLLAENAKLKAELAAKPVHRRISGDDLSCWRVNEFDRPGDAVFTDPGGDTHSAGKLHECATWIKNLVLAAAVELQRRDKAKPAPVADAEIRRVLEDMAETINRLPQIVVVPSACIQDPDRGTVKRWHDTLQAVAADLVVARESLEKEGTIELEDWEVVRARLADRRQVTKVKNEMRDGRDSAVKVMRGLTEELAQCKAALPEELRGGSVVLGISALIRSRTYAREQASQYARRYAEARDERDALSSKLSKVQAAIAKALEL